MADMPAHLFASQQCMIPCHWCLGGRFLRPHVEIDNNVSEDMRKIMMLHSMAEHALVTAAIDQLTCTAHTSLPSRYMSRLSSRPAPFFFHGLTGR